jgi:transcriptional regulator with XRE-family HTH domain
MTDKPEFTDWLRRRMATLGLTIKDLGDRLGKSKSGVGHWLRGPGPGR